MILPAIVSLMCGSEKGGGLPGRFTKGGGAREKEIIVRKRSKPIGTEESLLEGGSGDTRQFVVALHRGLEVLRCFQPGDRALGNQEIAERTELPNSTVSRLTYTLSTLGYLEYLEDAGKYRISIAVLRLGYSYLAGLSIQEVARPAMKRLAEFCGAGTVVGLGGRDELSMIYIAAARGKSVISLTLDVGSRISLVRSSMGRAYIAGLPEDERKPLLEKAREYVGALKWPQIEDGILRSIEEVQTQGFCLNVGEWQSEVSSVGVPFWSRQEDRLLAFNCGALSYLMPRERLKNEIGPALVEMTEEIRRSTISAS